MMKEGSVVISLWFGVELPLLMALLQYLVEQRKINEKMEYFACRESLERTRIGKI